MKYKYISNVEMQWWIPEETTDWIANQQLINYHITIQCSMNYKHISNIEIQLRIKIQILFTILLRTGSWIANQQLGSEHSTHSFPSLLSCGEAREFLIYRFKIFSSLVSCMEARELFKVVFLSLYYRCSAPCLLSSDVYEECGFDVRRIFS